MMPFSRFGVLLFVSNAFVSCDRISGQQADVDTQTVVWRSGEEVGRVPLPIGDLFCAWVTAMYFCSRHDLGSVGAQFTDGAGESFYFRFTLDKVGPSQYCGRINDSCGLTDFFTAAGFCDVPDPNAAYITGFSESSIPDAELTMFVSRVYLTNLNVTRSVNHQYSVVIIRLSPPKPQCGDCVVIHDGIDGVTGMKPLYLRTSGLRLTCDGSHRSAVPFGWVADVVNPGGNLGSVKVVERPPPPTVGTHLPPAPAQPSAAETGGGDLGISDRVAQPDTLPADFID